MRAEGLAACATRSETQQTKHQLHDWTEIVKATRSQSKHGSARPAAAASLTPTAQFVSEITVQEGERSAGDYRQARYRGRAGVLTTIMTKAGVREDQGNCCIHTEAAPGMPLPPVPPPPLPFSFVLVLAGGVGLATRSSAQPTPRPALLAPRPPHPPLPPIALPVSNVWSGRPLCDLNPHGEEGPPLRRGVGGRVFPARRWPARGTPFLVSTPPPTTRPAHSPAAPTP